MSSKKNTKEEPINSAEIEVDYWRRHAKELEAKIETLKEEMESLEERVNFSNNLNDTLARKFDHAIETITRFTSAIEFTEYSLARLFAQSRLLELTRRQSPPSPNLHDLFRGK